MQDKEAVLMNAQEGVTKALRQWRFSSLEEIIQSEVLIKKYIVEALNNQDAGLTIAPNKSKPLVVPEELKRAFKSHEGLEANFENLNLTKKREFAEYIADAKRTETKEKRLQKIIPMILEGVGLNDKYR